MGTRRSLIQYKKDYGIYWDAPMLTIEARNSKGEQIKTIHSKPSRLIVPERWKQIAYDFQVPNNTDKLLFYFWQPQKNKEPLCVEGFIIEAFD